MTPEEHQAEHVRLHQAFDQLLACYITSRRDGLVNRGSIHDEILHLLHWSYEKTMKPTPSPEHAAPDPRSLMDFQSERQMIILALAELALSRPGWDQAISAIVKNFDSEGLPLFKGFKNSSADRVKLTHKAI